MNPFHLPGKLRHLLTLTGHGLALLLAFLGSCGRLNATPSRGGGNLQRLDEQASPHIARARNAVPDAVRRLSDSRGRLLCLYLADQISGDRRAWHHIHAVIGPTVLAPLRDAARIYGCGTDSSPSVDLVAETVDANLRAQGYCAGGLAIEAVFLPGTMQACVNVLGSCAPKLLTALGLAGTAATLDGPLPVGDLAAVALAGGSAAWCYSELRDAYRALPAELEAALNGAIDATVIQCRLEAATEL